MKCETHPECLLIVPLRVLSFSCFKIIKHENNLDCGIFISISSFYVNYLTNCQRNNWQTTKYWQIKTWIGYIQIHHSKGQTGINFKKYMRCKCNTHAWNSQNKSKIKNHRECKQLRTLVWGNKIPSYHYLIYKKLHWDWKNSSVVKNTSWLFGGSRPGFSS